MTLVLVDVADRVATITQNRPEARNALNGDLLEGFTRALATADADDDIDVLVVDEMGKNSVKPSTTPRTTAFINSMRSIGKFYRVVKVHHLFGKMGSKLA